MGSLSGRSSMSGRGVGSWGLMGLFSHSGRHGLIAASSTIMSRVSRTMVETWSATQMTIAQAMSSASGASSASSWRRRSTFMPAVCAPRLKLVRGSTKDCHRFTVAFQPPWERSGNGSWRRPPIPPQIEFGVGERSTFPIPATAVGHEVSGKPFYCHWVFVLFPSHPIGATATTTAIDTLVTGYNKRRAPITRVG